MKTETIIENTVSAPVSSPDLVVRPRRLRATAALRSMVRETHLRVDQLIMPLFILEGSNRKIAIDPMPGIFQMSTDMALFEIEKIVAVGIPAIILFGIPDSKDSHGSTAWQADGVVQKQLEK